MKRELGGFRHRPHEHQQAQRQSSPARNAAVAQGSSQAISDALEIKAAGGPEQAEDAKQQTEVADPVDDESLLGGVGSTVAVVPETHQQVGAHAHQLPEHINLEKIWADHKPQHRAAEQGQIGEKAHVALVVRHVAMGVDQHQQSDGGDQGQHHGTKRIHHVAHGQAEGSGAGPNEEMFDRRGAVELLKQHRVADHRSSANAAEKQHSDWFSQSVNGAVETDQSHAGDQRSNKGEHRDQPGVISGRMHPGEAGCK